MEEKNKIKLNEKGISILKYTFLHITKQKY